MFFVRRNQPDNKSFKPHLRGCDTREEVEREIRKLTYIEDTTPAWYVVTLEDGTEVNGAEFLEEYA